MSDIKTKTTLKGGEFLIKETNCRDIFIPEEWTEEQKLIAQSCHDFLAQEVWPNLDKLDNKEEGLMVKIMDKAAELGMLGLGIPEQYGGFEKDFLTGMLATESIGGGNSFAVSVAAHTGIGTLPILYYGNDEQKTKYLPKLATGEWKACYCLTEPGAGSDANSGKTKAVPSADGKTYTLNGQKMWITNSGFADIFIVFAKIEDDKNLSAFIVEKSFGGITLNPEEHKMGIKGSSTRQVFFNDFTAGAGWAGNIKNAGFKGEVSYFTPYNHFSDINVIAASLSVDYGFKNGIYILFSGLYNSVGKDSIPNIAELTTASLSAKNIFPFRYTLFGEISYPFSPIFKASLGTMYSLSGNSFIVLPTLTYSVADNWVLDFIGQSFFTQIKGKYTALGNGIYLRLKWGF